jgi:predicted glycoside hydrolase/deacetylase ChbG (UPF0249 family)
VSGAAAPGTSTPRRWIVCADDFGIDPGATEAIVHLIDRGRVTATSALVTSPHWPAAAAALPERLRKNTAAPRGVDIGLHLNLTEAFAGAAFAGPVWPLAQLIMLCAARLLPRTPLRAAIARQLDAYEDAMGRRPDYVDGHQHVHQFAVVREELVAQLQRRYGTDLPWLRSTRPPPAVRELKARGIAALGERGLRTLAARARIAQNAWLVGVYDLLGVRGDMRGDMRGDNPQLKQARYRQDLLRWMRAGPDGTALMCHPATHAAAADPIGAARSVEYAVLDAEDFNVALAAANIALASGSALLRPAAAATAKRRA